MYYYNHIFQKEIPNVGEIESFFVNTVEEVNIKNRSK